MLVFEEITIKNFMSIGNIPQTVKLDDNRLNLILGRNLDQPFSDSANGVGKTTIIHALSYVLFDTALLDMKKEQLINMTNHKNMLVTLKFRKDNVEYTIERGRKPNILRLFIDGNEEERNEALGESKWTQEEIEKIIGTSHQLFKHSFALHTKNIPFLSLRPNDQREIIEELLGISQLSKKAEILKIDIKNTKDLIRDEETRLNTIQISNDKIERTISDMRLKSSIWERENKNNITKINNQIHSLQEIDISMELENHKKLSEWQSNYAKYKSIEKDIIKLNNYSEDIEQDIKLLNKSLANSEGTKCPLCSSDINEHNHNQIVNDINLKISELQKKKDKIDDEIMSLAEQVQQLDFDPDSSSPEVIYSSIEDVYNHRHTLEKLQTEKIRLQDRDNPFLEQIATLQTTSIQDVNYDTLNSLNDTKDHQEFLLKLLTNKDSFIRKKIIDQNISYLNKRLNYYLELLGLPHEVIFNSDLSVSIYHLGNDYSFSQLSNGESNRIVLSLAWSFRDTWETLNFPLNILFIDELIDNGMDGQGMDASINILKSMCRDRNKNIFLISHKDSLESRVDKVITVVKENNFTRLEME